MWKWPSRICSWIERICGDWLDHSETKQSTSAKELYSQDRYVIQLKASTSIHRYPATAPHETQRPHGSVNERDLFSDPRVVDFYYWYKWLQSYGNSKKMEN
jgi:hypothetical protein